MRAVRDAAQRASRELDPLNLTVGLGLSGPESATPQRIDEVVAMGFGRVLFVLNANDRDRDTASMERYAALVAARR